MLDAVVQKMPPFLRKYYKFIVPAIVLVVGLAGVKLYFSGNYEKEIVKKALDEWSWHVRDAAKANGRDITFTYEDIEIEGGLLGHSVTLIKPKLVNKEYEDREMLENLKNIFGQDITGKDDNFDEPTSTYELQTEEAKVYPKSLDFKTIKVEFSHPFEVLKNSQIVTFISPKQPWSITHKETEDDRVHYLAMRIDLPSRTSFDLRGDQVGEYEISFSGDSELHLKNVLNADAVKEGADLSYFSLNSKNVELSGTGFYKPVQIKSLDWKIHKKAAKDGWVDMDHQLSVQGLDGDKAITPYGAMAVEANFNLKSPMDFIRYLRQQRMINQKYDLNIANISVTVPEVNVKAEGHLINEDGGMLPTGDAQIHVTDFTKVRDLLNADKALKPEQWALLDNFMKITVGSGVNDAKDVTLKLHRAKGEPFRIGNTTFEEALALALSGGKAKVHVDPVAPSSSPAASEGEKTLEDAISSEPAATEPTKPEEPKAASPTEEASPTEAKPAQQPEE